MDKKQRILTVDDLYKCCVENDIFHFSAEDSNKRLVVSTQGYFEAEEDDEIQETEGLMGLKVKIFHTGKNRNKSFISKENTEKYMSSIKNRPLLAYIHQLPDGSYDFKQHDRRTVVNADGEEEIEYLESPIGHFTNDEPWLEEDKKKKDRYYVLGKAVVYEEYTKACEILKNKNGSDCSVELEIQDFSFDAKNKTLNIESFFIKGVTLLGSKVNVKTGKVEKVLPGMEGAKVTLEDFMSNTSSDGCFENNEQKGGNEDMNKFEELLAKYNKTAEDIDFDYADMSDEELENKFAELFEDAGAEEGAEDTVESTEESAEGTQESTAETTVSTEELEPAEEVVVDDEEGKKSEKKKSVLSVNELENGDLQVSFELSHDAKRGKIYKALSKIENDPDFTGWLDLLTVYDNYFIARIYTRNDDELFGQRYEFDANDNLVLIDEPYQVHAEFLTNDEYAALNEMRSNYSAMVSELETYKLNEARQSKEDVLIKDETFSQYLDEEEFKELKASMDKYSLDEFKEKADSAYGKVIKRLGAPKNASFSMPRHQVFSFENKIDSPYGDLFKK